MKATLKFVALVLLAVTMFAACEPTEKEDDPTPDPTGDGGAITLANSPGAGSEVYVTDYALDGDTDYQTVVDDNIAHGTISADNTCEFSQWEGDNTGTFSVLVGSPGTTRATGGSVFKYQNGVRFTDGVASLNWDEMIVLGGGDDGGEIENVADFLAQFGLTENDIKPEGYTSSRLSIVFNAPLTGDIYISATRPTPENVEPVKEWMLQLFAKMKAASDDGKIYTAVSSDEEEIDEPYVWFLELGTITVPVWNGAWTYRYGGKRIWVTASAGGADDPETHSILLQTASMEGNNNDDVEGIPWPENEYTALIPEPTSGRVYRESQFEASEFYPYHGQSIDMISWPMADCKAYVELIKQLGFTIPHIAYDDVVQRDTPQEYIFQASREVDGVSVSVHNNTQYDLGFIQITVPHI